MNKMALRTALTPDREELTIELWMNDQALGHINLAAADLDAFIHKLGQHRAAMPDQVPAELDPGARIEAVSDPIWRIPDVEAQKARVLCLRHPGLGWLGFTFPDHEAKEIAQWLSKDLPCG